MTKMTSVSLYLSSKSIALSGEKIQGSLQWGKYIKGYNYLTCISLASFLWDIGKQYNPRCDAAFCGVPSGAILYAQRNFVEK